MIFWFLLTSTSVLIWTFPQLTAAKLGHMLMFPSIPKEEPAISPKLYSVLWALSSSLRRHKSRPQGSCWWHHGSSCSSLLLILQPGLSLAPVQPGRQGWHKERWRLYGLALDGGTGRFWHSSLPSLNHDRLLLYIDPSEVLHQKLVGAGNWNVWQTHIKCLFWIIQKPWLLREVHGWKLVLPCSFPGILI